MEKGKNSSGENETSQYDFSNSTMKREVMTKEIKQQQQQAGNKNIQACGENERKLMKEIIIMDTKKNSVSHDASYKDIRKGFWSHVIL